MRKSVTLFLLMVVIALGWACEDILEVPDISDQEVVLLAPLNQTVVVDSIVDFNWEEVGEATAYSVQLASPDFENAAQILLDSLMVVDSTFVTPRATLKLSDGPYEWRVKALNSGFETPYSNSAFTVDTSN